MIIAENIVKNYGETTALNNINLSVEDSELFGLIGPDGAGKTTFFRIVSTLIVPDKGKMTVMGKDTITDYKELRKHIGYMPGRFSLYHDLTVEENLKFYATVFNTSIKENYHLIRDIYSHIEAFKTRPAGKLSGGMKQKLALCCALIHAPKLIVLDEPTTGVDAVSRMEFWEMLKKLKEEGITILVSTPYMDEAVLCDRVGLIQDGDLLETDKPENIISGYEKNLYAVSAEDKFRLIKFLKAHPGIESVNPFGDSIHVTFKNNKYDGQLLQLLISEGYKDADIKEIEPCIEDVFLHLMTKMKND